MCECLERKNFDPDIRFSPSPFTFTTVLFLMINHQMRDDPMLIFHHGIKNELMGWLLGLKIRSNLRQVRDQYRSISRPAAGLGSLFQDHLH